MLRRIDLVRVLLLAAFAALAITSLVQESPTWDEPYHLAQGFRFWRTGDPSFFVEEHPPVVQALAAAPLVLAGRPLEPLPRDEPRSRPQRAFAIREFLAAHDGAALGLFPWAKSVVVLLAVVLGWLVYSEAHRLYGIGGARLALALFCFDPNVLAHARLVTTDLGITLGVWLVLVAILRWSRRPTIAHAVVVGLAFGFALVAKYSAIATVMVSPILIAVLCLGRRDPPPRGTTAASTLVAFATALLVVWGVHGFTFGTVRSTRPDARLAEPTPPTETSRDDRRSYRIGSFLESLPMPAPDYVFGLRWTLRHVYEFGHWSYLHGKYGKKGWREFFPIAFAIKTPLPTLILLLVLLASFVRARPRREEVALLAFVVLYFAAAARGSLNIGYRHILPILPPLFVLAGRIAAPSVRASLFGRASKAAPFALAALLVWLVAGTARIHPHYLAYFNETIGGPKNGWKWLVDASLDWGQDLSGLARWLRANRVETVNLSYYGSMDPAVYGVRWLPIRIPLTKEGTKPRAVDIPPGVYAVSASNLVEVLSAGAGPLTVFQEIEPTATIGHSIFVYRIPEPPSPGRS
jgi:hypothetical protein